MTLGVLDGQVLIFGSPYSNLPATLKIRERAEALGIPPARVICTGDLVAYCASPEAVVEEIRDWTIPVVMGNCEESLAKHSPDCGCGFDRNSACALLSDSWYDYANRHISPESRIWMGDLPREIRFQLAGREFVIIHGAPSSINRFLFASSPVQDKQWEIDIAQSEVIVGGHSGIPFGQQIGQAYWLNAGVVGMPANDGSQNGWYLLITPEKERLKVEWYRLEYAWQKAQASMQRAGLDNGYAQALKTGLWPSMDILPRQEQAQQGRRIKLAPMYIAASGA
jgi:predicted phosphodiesterase